uniref:Uncharacterized protein n=1 Tax=Heterorhabditis bacteriophora TaxID=37862 RepID=A0A1I7X4V3_HETBA
MKRYSPLSIEAFWYSILEEIYAKQAFISRPTRIPRRDSSQHSHAQTLKRKAGRSLDATVRKLSEKRKAEVVHDDSPPNGPAWQPPLDPQAYLNMIRMMQTPQTSIFSNIMGQM